MDGDRAALMRRIAALAVAEDEAVLQQMQGQPGSQTDAQGVVAAAPFDALPPSVVRVSLYCTEVYPPECAAMGAHKPTCHLGHTGCLVLSCAAWPRKQERCADCRARSRACAATQPAAARRSACSSSRSTSRCATTSYTMRAFSIYKENSF